MATRLYYHPVFVEHLTPEGHCERPDRLRAVMSALEADEFSALDRAEAPLADEALLSYAHPERFVEKIRSIVPLGLVDGEVEDSEAEQPIVQIDGDTYVSPQSLNAVLAAVGASVAAVDDVFSGQVDNAFIACRPPGHHAERERAMGFCLFNSAANAARYAQQHYQAERIAIIDWDVHHGNGTQDIFQKDRSVLFCSTHQSPLYPGTGAKSETGLGNIVNAPLSAGDGSSQFREAFRTRVLPALDKFEPDLIIISAGFDAHYLDPLAQINLTEEDFDWATGHLMERAEQFCNHRMISLLEGGYDLQGLSLSAAAHIKRLMEG